MRNVHRRLRFLEIYAVLSSLVFVVLAVSAFMRDPVGRFEELSVERLNVVEKNGTPRLVVANNDRMPDPVIDGKPFKTERPSGMVFYNRRGDEDGGIIFDGVSKDGGQYGAYAGLSFDQYRQSQIVALTYNDHTGSREAGLHVWDRPETSLADLIEKRKVIQAMPEGPEKMSAQKSLVEAELSPSRIFVGRDKNDEAQLTLCDAKGKPRINIGVTAKGEARIEFLDDSGQVTYSLPNPKEK